MARRSTPPLFELLNEAEAKADRSARLGAARDAAMGRPKPPPPKKPEPPKPAKKPDPKEPWRIDSTKRVAVPLSVILIGAAGLILVAVIGVSAAWKLGFGSGSEGSQRVLNQIAPEPLIDPLVENLPVNEDLIGDDPPARDESPPQQQPTRGGGAFIVAGGALEADPRIAGDNYLMIASRAAKIDLAEARRVTAFFQENGLEVVCVPVDRGSRASNNAGYYDVFVLQGVPGDQFSARRNEREDLERRVAQLGRTWQREHTGTTDFQRPQWTKHTP